MSKIFPKINIKFHSNVITHNQIKLIFFFENTTKLSYYITTHFIINNKDYNSYRNPYSIYQTYPKL